MIPNILWQTWKTQDVPESLKHHYNSWATSNPQLERRLVDDQDMQAFILEHFGEERYRLFMLLPQPIMRADLWRLAVVYVHGGYYADLDMYAGTSLNNIIDPSVDAVFMREINNISNYFFGAVAGHPVLKMALDYMFEEAKIIVERDTQSFGMHNLHRSVREYYGVVDTNYVSDDQVQFLLDADMRHSQKLVHTMASSKDLTDYVSWRAQDQVMQEERESAEPLLFFTTFNQNGYDLYGRSWVDSFIRVANYYNKFRALIFYEGFIPDPEHYHPLIEWVDYDSAIPHHKAWKLEYQQRNRHADYVRTMTVRFSHKGFVIQHVLDKYKEKFMIWLDGDCIFKNADYAGFPRDLLGDKFLACQIEHCADINHVESGILIFDGQHLDTARFNQELKGWYDVNKVLEMGQPYDGFIVYKSLLTSGAAYVNLNEATGGGIQSDPGLTFLHPEIKKRFIHNIGWTGKNQYENWSEIYERDDIYQKMRDVLFGALSPEAMRKKQQKARTKLKHVLSEISRAARQ